MVWTETVLGGPLTKKMLFPLSKQAKVYHNSSKLLCVSSQSMPIKISYDPKGNTLKYACV